LKTKWIFTILVLFAVLMSGCLPVSRVALNTGPERVGFETIPEDHKSGKDFPAEVPMQTEPATLAGFAQVDLPRAAQDSSTSSQQAGSTSSLQVSPVKSLWKDIWTLPDVVITETQEVAMKPGNAWLLMAAGAGSIAMHNSGADSKVAKNFANRGNLNRDVDKIGDYMGGPGQHFAAAGLWYLASANAGDDFNKDRAWTMLKALSVTGASTLGLKLVRNNDCPNGKSLAWPSGHTSSSFTVAAVLDEFYGPEVGIPAYIGASFVGYRMMDSGDHWASDVLFGGVLGYLVGHHVAGKDGTAKFAGFDVAPMTMLETGEPATGLLLIKTF